jgi:hypothetical protein
MNRAKNGNKTLRLSKCVHCRGQDGKGKDTYATFQMAFDTAKFVEENRGIYLTVYKCPHSNGWHLTKSDASSEITGRKETLFQNNDIPLKSSDGSWEYYSDEPDEDAEYEKQSIRKLVRIKKKGIRKK